MTDARPVMPYGAWPSPISIDLVLAGSIAVGGVQVDGPDTYWLEPRPAEGGRQVLRRHRGDGTVEDVTPPGFNVRTMVHEYGGGAFAVRHGLVVFSNLADGRLYSHRPGEEPRPMTPDRPWRYADLLIDEPRDRVLCILEDHTESDQEPRNAVASVDLASGDVTVLVEEADFYSHPRPDPTGTRLCWLQWQRPDMPWDATELWVARLGPDGVSEAARVAGGPGESVGQPEWAPDGTLVFASDRSGWWNLYRRRQDGAVEPVARSPAEWIDPQWVFGQSSYGVASDGTIVAAARSEGQDGLLRVPPGGPAEPVEQPFPELSAVRVGEGRVAFAAAGPTDPWAVVDVDLASGGLRILHRPAELPVDRAYLSVPQPISFPSTDAHTAHALYYPPTNPDVRAPDGELPPLIVLSHGGPTSNATATLDLEHQFFTSRGFAIVDVDYGGSTGYGRAYRERLDGTWGIVDVADCAAAATWLADRGLADPARLIIRGGSAGGYTTLQALCTTRVFAAGASHYGVGDLEALARDTHKFESRYLDRMVGPYPDRVDVYRERSPIHHTDRLSCPLILFQGLDDRVVPPAQAEAMARALDERGIPHAYLAFEGEGHGFRRAQTMRRVMEAELSFYAQLFGFEPADPVDRLPIAHLEGWRERMALSRS
jgi:dipeptidyl aminopeptidase/acylaminoacyl peptidase